MMQEHLQKNASALEAIATITRVITEQGKQTQMEAREGQKTPRYPQRSGCLNLSGCPGSGQEYRQVE